MATGERRACGVAGVVATPAVPTLRPPGRGVKIDIDPPLPTPMDLDLPSGTAILARTPQTLRAMLAGLPAEWIDATEGPDTWSPRMIVGHLVHAERENWIPRARLILAQGPERRFTPFDRMPAGVADAPLERLLDDLARLRAGNLATLHGWDLGDAELALEGVHPEFGPVTLRQLLATWVVHDLSHLAQTTRVMAAQYRDAVGPWRANLRVLGG